MEIPLSPELEARLKESAAQTGRPASEIVEDAVRSFLDEAARLRELLEERCADLDSGRVKAIDGEEAYQLLIERTDAQRRKRTA